jgi:hypothetical protein
LEARHKMTELGTETSAHQYEGVKARERDVSPASVLDDTDSLTAPDDEGEPEVRVSSFSIPLQPPASSSSPAVFLRPPKSGPNSTNACVPFPPPIPGLPGVRADSSDMSLTSLYTPTPSPYGDVQMGGEEEADELEGGDGGGEDGEDEDEDEGEDNEAEKVTRRTAAPLGGDSGALGGDSGGARPPLSTAAAIAAAASTTASFAELAPVVRPDGLIPGLHQVEVPGLRLTGKCHRSCCNPGAEREWLVKHKPLPHLLPPLMPAMVGAVQVQSS